MTSKSTVILDHWSTSGGTQVRKSDLVNILVAKKGGLGAFHVKHYGAYQGRNPKTGEPIAVRAKRGLLFRAGKELKDRVNRPGPDGKVPPLNPGQ